MGRNMRISPESTEHLERIFALQMMFLGLTVLLGLIILIQYGSPSRRMNADGMYTAAPVYGVPHYPGPIEDYIDDDGESTTHSSVAGTASSEHSSEGVRSPRSSSAKSREYNRRTQRTRGGLRGRVTNDEDEGGYAPGWFWR